MNRNKWKLGMMAVVLTIIMIGLAIPQPARAQAWKQKVVRLSGVAGETLATGDVVCIASADGQIYLADADSSTRRPAIGVIAKGGAVNSTVEIVPIGVISGMTAASPGARLYLSNTAGDFSTSAVTNEQMLGWVMPGTTDTATSTTYMIMVVMPVSDGAAY